ncbi:MAG TPA: DUF2141 domain-containing protein [Stellaceae bacterium]|nr:DUF2141 domain-containing protein [Stellaceae bacterium]
MRAIALAFLFLATTALSEATAPLTVTVQNIRNDHGDIRLSVFASAAEWPSHSSIKEDTVLPAHAGSVVFKLDLPPGTYAINGYHDENRNKKLDRTALGIPEEGYFFSNNVKPFLSVPSFDAAKFTLPAEGAAITIDVDY